MDDGANTATCVAAIAAVLSVLIYAIQAYFNHKQVKASLEQLKVSQNQLWVSQDQVRVSQDQIYATWRPLLVPAESEQPYTPAQQGINVRNVGTGTALNIRGVIFGHKSTRLDDKDRYPQKFGFVNPLSPGDPLVLAAKQRGKPKFKGNYEIGNQHRTCIFFAPERTQDELSGGMTLVVQRLVLTYHDLQGLKYTSIFDYTDRRLWEFVAFLPYIPKDIDDIELEYQNNVSSP